MSCLAWEKGGEFDSALWGSGKATEIETEKSEEEAESPAVEEEPVREKRCD